MIYKRYIGTVEYYSVIEKKEILPFATTWMDLEGTTLREISQRMTKTLLFHLCVESKKKKKEKQTTPK